MGAWSFIVCAGLAVCGPSCARPPLKGNMTACSALLRFGGPSSGTSVRRRSCGQRRVTRSWWNWLCDRYFAAILRSTARRLQLENDRDSTLSKRSLRKWTRSSSIVRSRVAPPTGRHQGRGKAAMKSKEIAGNFRQKLEKKLNSGGHFWFAFWFHFWVLAILVSIRAPRSAGPKTGPSKSGLFRRQARQIWWKKKGFSD